MSKITVRADDDLVERLDALDASKSQVVREALRAYLDGDGDAGGDAGADPLTEADVIQDADGGVVDSGGRSLDDLVTERVDELVTARLDEALESREMTPRRRAQDVNVNVTVDGAATQAEETAASDATTAAGVAEGGSSDAAVSDGRAAASASDDGGRGDGEPSSCAQCGSDVGADHVYCPNCGEKATRRAFCECGDEVRSDWAFCPGCGRRTPAAGVLDSG